MAADDDDEIPTDPEEALEDEAGDLDAEPEEPDADELDEEDDGFTAIEEDDDDDAVEEPEAEEDEEEGDGDADATTTRTRRRAGEEEEDDDDELLSPDDVEADLDRILKDRLVTADDEDEDEDDEPDDRVDGGDRLQPKRADEQLCPNCFLLVRATAPGCPVGDDSCPIFG